MLHYYICIRIYRPLPKCSMSMWIQSVRYTLRFRGRWFRIDLEISVVTWHRLRQWLLRMFSWNIEHYPSIPVSVTSPLVFLSRELRTDRDTDSFSSEWGLYCGICRIWFRILEVYHLKTLNILMKIPSYVT